MTETFNADAYGFSVTGSADSNRNSVATMLTAAAGSPCIIQANADFEMNRIDLEPLAFDIDLTFTGSGRQLRASGGAFVLRSEFDNIQPITAFARTTRTIDGNLPKLTRLSVADSSGYARGDLAKIVSDNVDPDARDTTGLRGEFAEVIDVSPGCIWLSSPLEDYGLYTTNPRVGRMVKRKVSVKGHRVRSALTNTGGMVYLGALHEPYYELDIDQHGQMAISMSGCVRSDIHMNGSGKGDSAGSLGYGVLDASGLANRIVARGAGWRHLTTTGHNGATAGGNLRNYGATRDHTVIDSVSMSGENAAFDDHEGARRSKWINCAAYGAMDGTNQWKVAFQIRGANSMVINPYADASFDGMVGVTKDSVGTVTVDGGFSECRPLAPPASPNATGALIYLNNHTSAVKDVLLNPGAVLRGYGIRAVVNGGSYSLEVDGCSNVNVLSANLAGSVWVLNGPEFILRGTPINGRFIHLSDVDGTIIGSVKTRNLTSGGSVQAIVRSDGSANGNAARLKIAHVEGARPPVTSGSFGAIGYAVHDAVGGSHATNVTTVDDLAKLLAAAG